MADLHGRVPDEPLGIDVPLAVLFQSECPFEKLQGRGDIPIQDERCHARSVRNRLDSHGKPSARRQESRPSLDVTSSEFVVDLNEERPPRGTA